MFTLAVAGYFRLTPVGYGFPAVGAILIMAGIGSRVSGEGEESISIY